MEEIGFERFMELGARHLADRDPDGAVHYFNSALRAEPESPAARLGLGKALSLKGGRDGKVFYVLALDALRKAAPAYPSSEELQGLIIAAAAKADRLGDLAQEYRGKLTLAPGDQALKSGLKLIYAVSLLDRDVKLPSVGYKPALFVKVFFDCVLLPFSTAMIVAANVYPKARPSLMIGVFIFFCYVVYRSLIIYFTRKL